MRGLPVHKWPATRTGGAGMRHPMAGFDKIVSDMDKDRHPKVIRTWLTTKIGKRAPAKAVRGTAERKPEPHNKT